MQRIVSAVVALISLGIALAAVPREAQGQAAPQSGRFSLGDVVLNFQGGNMEVEAEDNILRLDVTGPRVSLTSTPYDISARRLQVTAAKASRQTPYRLTKAVATDNVRIVTRQPEAGRVNTITCNSAFFTAANQPPAIGRIDLKGDVRWTATDPGFAGPAVNTADSGYIELLGPNKTRIVLNNGTLKATPRERATKK